MSVPMVETEPQQQLEFTRGPCPRHPMPEPPCEQFYRELQFVRNKDAILKYMADKKREKAERMAKARTLGELQTCPCCYDEEVLLEDMLACPADHLFCRDCIRRSAEVAVGDGKGQFVCLSDECETEFSVETLSKVLPAKTMSLCLRKMQEESIRLADIQDLVCCPFCPFATIMPDPDDKLFRCLNPECLKESCRLCKEPNHIPLRCDEIEGRGEKNMRAFIEAQMTEAMIRTCWRCKKRFTKLDGCNKMTCTCGAMMCYVCREPIKDYSHFQNGKCTQDSNLDVLHTSEMVKAAEEAKKKYLEQHPELTGTTLKHDPLKLIDQSSVESSRLGAHQQEWWAPPHLGMPQVQRHLQMRGHYPGRRERRDADVVRAAIGQLFAFPETIVNARPRPDNPAANPAVDLAAAINPALNNLEAMHLAAMAQFDFF